MPPISDVIAFAIASFLIIIIPGPSVLFTIGRGISYGKKAALVNVAGNSVGMFIGSLGVAIGIGTFVQSSDIAYALVGVLGGGYLVYLGYDTYRTRKAVAQALVSTADPTPMGQLVRTMLESGVKLGVSSRGSGNISEYGGGEVSDFEIITVDVVAQPSAPGAYPTPIYEHLMNTRGGMKAMGMAAEVRNDKRAQRYLKDAITNVIKGLK